MELNLDKTFSLIRDKQELLRLLTSVVVHAKDAIIITDANPIDEPGPAIVYVNQSFLDMTGYAIDEVLGRSPRFLQGEETYRKELDKIRQSMISRQPTEVELVNYKKNGEKFWVNFSVIPIYSSGNELTHFISIQKDVTERKRVNRELEESEAKFKLIFHSVTHHLELYNQKGELAEANHVSQDFSDKANGRTRDLFQQPFVNERVEKKLIAREAVHLEHAYKSSGDIFQITIQPIKESWFVGYLVQKINITDRKNKEKAILKSLEKEQLLNEELKLREEEIFANEEELRLQLEQNVKDRKVLQQNKKRFQELFENNLEGLLILDYDLTNNSFRIIDINKAALKDEPREKTFILGKLLFEVYPGLTQLKKSLNLVHKTGKPKYIPPFNYEIIDQEVWGEAFIYKLPSEELVLNFKVITEQVKINRDLEEISTRLHLATDAAKLGIFDWDMVNDKLYWDDRQYEIFGVENKNQVLSIEEWWNCALPEDASIVDEKLKHLIKNQKELFSAEFRINTKLGFRHIKAYGKLIYDQKGDAVRLVGMNWDITTSKEIFEDLKRNEEQLRQITDSITDIISTVNDQWKFNYISPSFTRMLGFSFDDVQSHSMFEYVHPDDLESTIEAFNQCIQDKAPGIKELRYLKKDGTYIWLEVRGNMILNEEGEITGAVFGSSDITERKKAGEQLQQSTKALNDLKTALDVSNIVSFTDANGYISYVNRHFERVTGYESEEVLGKKPNILKSGHHNQAFYEDMWKVIAAGKIWRGEIQNRAKDGSLFWVDITIIPFLDQNKTPFQYVAVMNDITDQKRFEGMLIAQNDQLKRANEELDGLVYSASHDLRAPLTSVLGLIDLTELTDDRTEMQQYLKLMRKSIAKLDDTIQQITHQSRNARLELDLQEINFNELIDDTIEQLGYLNNLHPLDFRIKIKLKDPFYSDLSRLEVLFKNLVSNAIKYSNVNNDESFLEISINDLDIDEIQLVFRDNGIGIHKNELPLVFNMFHRSTSLSNGSGLGLYIVQETVKKLKGSISLNSEYGIGTTFNIVLPRISINHQ